MKLLLIEDEQRLADFIKKGLEADGNLVDMAFDGKEGLNMAFQNEYDIIILDINMPKMNGYDVTQAIRNERQETPILMLTAMGSIADKALGYEAGIDDFLVKPFQFQELVMRLRALHRRSNIVENQIKKNVIQVADLKLDLSSKTITRAGHSIDLTAKEFALLEYLLINTNRVVTKLDIAEKIWNTNLDPTSNTIDTYINFLRKKVDRGFNEKLIHTIVGLGYILKIK